MFNSGEIIALVAIAASFILLFVPIAALTTRKVVKDVAEVLGRRRGGAVEESEASLERLSAQLHELRRRVGQLESTVGRIEEDADFHRELQAGGENRS